MEGWSLLVSVLSLVVSLAGLAGVVYTRLPYEQAQLHEDEEYRREVAGRLRGSGLGERYRGSLARALAGLDRLFGEHCSASAFGVCVWIALGYAYASFFLGWGFFGGAGNIGGYALLPDDAAQPGRGRGAAAAGVLSKPLAGALAQPAGAALQGRLAAALAALGRAARV